MQWIVNRSRRLVIDEDGPTSTEYAVMLALIIIVCIAAIGLLGEKVNGVFSKAADMVPTTTT